VETIFQDDPTARYEGLFQITSYAVMQLLEHALGGRRTEETDVTKEGVDVFTREDGFPQPPLTPRTRDLL
jgi:hypothetical protein